MRLRPAGGTDALQGPLQDTIQGEIPGAAKAAVVLLALGAEVAAEVVRHLDPGEVQSLVDHLARARHLARDQVVAVLREFREATCGAVQVVFDTEGFLQEVLARSLGVEAGADLFDRLAALADSEAIAALQGLDGDWIHAHIKDEHPQIIATILALLEPGKASEVAAYFAPELRNELLLRVALLARVHPVALKDLNACLVALVSGEDRRQQAQGGIRPAADILNLLPEGMDEAALASIRERDPALAQRLVERMFVFEDLATIEPRALQTLLGEIPQDLLALALRGASEGLRRQVLANLPRSTAASVRENLLSTPPVKAAEVEQAQKEILARGRALHAEQRIVFARPRH